MAFSWTEVRVSYLRENAGKLNTREIAEAPGTSITAILNMAARLKLSLRVRRTTREQAEEVYKLYTSQENITLRNIAIQTGLSPGIVSYVLYSASRKTKPGVGGHKRTRGGMPRSPGTTAGAVRQRSPVW